MPDDIDKHLADIESVSEEVREKAILGLSGFSDLQAIFALKKAAREDDNLRLRQLARKVLLDLKKEISSVAPDLSSGQNDRRLNLKNLKAYLSSEDPQVRMNAIRSTVTFKDRRTVGILNAHIAEESDPLVKGMTLLALGIVGRSEVIAILTGMLKREKDPLVRKAIIEGLTYTRDVNVYPVILKVFVTDHEKLVQRACIKAINKLGRNNLMRLMRRMLASSRPWRRGVALRALGRFNSSAVVPMLRDALLDPQPELRVLAQKSLLRLSRNGNAAATAVVEELNLRVELPPKEAVDESELIDGSTSITLDDADPNVRLACIEAYAGSGDLSRLPLLKDRLKVETHDYVKGGLVTAIFRLAGREAVPILKECLKDPIDRVRANAVEALAKVGDESDSPLFIQMLKDKDPRTRANAIVALKKCDYLDLVRFIQQMIDTGDERMIKSAIHSIVEIASEKAVGLLAALAVHENSVIREKAGEGLEILKERGNSSAKKVLGRLQEKQLQPPQPQRGQKDSEVPPEPVDRTELKVDEKGSLKPQESAGSEQPGQESGGDGIVPAGSPQAGGSALPAVGTPAQPKPDQKASPTPQTPVPLPARPPAREAKAGGKPGSGPSQPPALQLPFDLSQGFSRATLDSLFGWLERLPATWRVALIALCMVWGMVFLMLVIQFIRGDE